MRYLAWFTAGLVGACGLCGWAASPMPRLAAAVSAVCLILWILIRKLGKKPILPLIFTGAALGFLWFSLYHTAYIAPADPHNGQTVEAEILITRRETDRDRGGEARGILTLKGKPYAAQVYLLAPMHLNPGDRISGSFRLQLTARVEGGRYPQQGVFWRAFQDDRLTVHPAETAPFWAAASRLGQNAEQTIRKIFPVDTEGFARALLLGDTDGLSYETRWQFSISGIRHLVAVSGLHVSVLCALLGLLTGKQKYLTFLLGIPVLFLFAAVIGFTPSVLRASIMMGLFLLARVLRRQYDPITELSAAVLVMVLLNPLTVLEPGFQLSCASVLGIFLFQEKLSNPLIEKVPWEPKPMQKLLIFIIRSLSLSLSSLVFVLPLCAFYFGTVSLIAPLTNLLTIFLVTPIFWGILLILAVAGFAPSAAVLLAKLLSYPIRYVLKVAALLSKVPMAAVFTDSLPFWIFLPILYGLGYFCFCRKRIRIHTFLKTAAAGFLLTLILAWGLPAVYSAGITMLDVGQGQCVLLRSRGRAFLVDCGGSRDEFAADQAVRRIRSQGIGKLDGLILTHFDRDHVGGAKYLLSQVETGAIYLPAAPELPGDSRIRVVTDRMDFHFSDTTLSIFPGVPQAEGNEMSLAVLLDSGVYDILITGDRSREGELHLIGTYPIPQVNCLVAGHHGAATSSCRELLQSVRPETVLISAGRQNRYGHPAEETLFRLQEMGCRILRTDKQGSITIWR